MAGEKPATGGWRPGRARAGGPVPAGATRVRGPARGIYTGGNGREIPLPPAQTRRQAAAPRTGTGTGAGAVERVTPKRAIHARGARRW